MLAGRRGLASVGHVTGSLLAILQLIKKLVLVVGDRLALGMGLLVFLDQIGLVVVAAAIVLKVFGLVE